MVIIKENPNGYGELALVPDENLSFKVFTKMKDSWGTRFSQREFDPSGIEMKRVSFYEGHTVRDIWERQDDLVTIKCRRIDIATSKEIEEFICFIDPVKENGRTLELGAGYTNELQGFISRPKSKEEIEAITKYLQKMILV